MRCPFPHTLPPFVRCRTNFSTSFLSSSGFMEEFFKKMGIENLRFKPAYNVRPFSLLLFSLSRAHFHLQAFLASLTCCFLLLLCFLPSSRNPLISPTPSRHSRSSSTTSSSTRRSRLETAGCSDLRCSSRWAFPRGCGFSVGD